ncbi:diguanylate cyclase, partial [bacterium]|nr:diguanylate cyclase [bacterium]
TDIHETADVVRFAERGLARIAEPIEIDGGAVVTSFSIGISLFPADGRDFATLQKQADTALYHAKERGRATYAFFAVRMSIESEERWRLYADLRRAVENNEFLLHYQPQVDIGSGRI